VLGWNHASRRLTASRLSRISEICRSVPLHTHLDGDSKYEQCANSDGRDNQQGGERTGRTGSIIQVPRCA
jgi:hypothetical protein